MTAIIARDERKGSLRVAILTETFYPVVGGGETQARTLAKSLIAHGMDTIVVTRRSDERLPAQACVDSIPVYRLPPTGSAHRKKWGLLFSSIPALIRLRAEYDVLLVSGFRVVGLAAVAASRLLGKGCVLKADSNGEMSGQFFVAGMAKVGLRPTNPFFRLFLATRNWMLRRANAFVAISQAVADELQENGVAPDKIWVIPNCVDTEIFRPVSEQTKVTLRESLGLSVGETIVVYTGRLVSYKGVPLLVRVWERLVAEQANMKLLLVGSGSLDIHNCEAELKAYVAEHGLEESVIFTGAVHNVESYLQAADIFVLPTEDEAFGLSVVEAMACALPVVSTTVGGIRDILEDGHNGVTVEANSFEQLLNALKRLLAQKELRSRLGKAARESARTRYGVESVTRQYMALFRSVVPAANRSSRTGDRR